MRYYIRMCILLSCLLFACVCLISCDKNSPKKTGRVVVTDVEYSIRQTYGAKEGHGNSFVVDANGKVKNVGEADVKKVVVTGYCRSCTQAFTSQQWFTSDCDKTPTQKDTIDYLAVGAEKEFHVEEVAFFFGYDPSPPDELPEKIEMVIESFETVE